MAALGDITSNGKNNLRGKLNPSGYVFVSTFRESREIGDYDDRACSAFASESEYMVISEVRKMFKQYVPLAGAAGLVARELALNTKHISGVSNMVILCRGAGESSKNKRKILDLLARDNASRRVFCI